MTLSYIMSGRKISGSKQTISHLVKRQSKLDGGKVATEVTILRNLKPVSRGCIRLQGLMDGGLKYIAVIAKEQATNANA
jgi:hypothetical protein